jgi:hypothetical protein
MRIVREIVPNNWGSHVKMPSLSPTQVSNLTSHSADLPQSNLSPFQFQSLSIPPTIKDTSLNLISNEAEQDQVALEFTHSSFATSPSCLLPPQSTPLSSTSTTPCKTTSTNLHKQSHTLHFQSKVHAEIVRVDLDDIQNTEFMHLNFTKVGRHLFTRHISASHPV